LAELEELLENSKKYLQVSKRDRANVEQNRIAAEEARANEELLESEENSRLFRELYAISEKRYFANLETYIVSDDFGEEPPKPVTTSVQLVELSTPCEARPMPTKPEKKKSPKSTETKPGKKKSPKSTERG